MLPFHSSKAAFSPYFSVSPHAQVFRSIEPKMAWVKRWIAVAGQNSSAHTGRIKTCFAESTFSADIPLYLVATKVFSCGLIALQTVIGSVNSWTC